MISRYILHIAFRFLSYENVIITYHTVTSNKNDKIDLSIKTNRLKLFGCNEAQFILMQLCVIYRRLSVRHGKCVTCKMGILRGTDKIATYHLFH